MISRAEKRLACHNQVISLYALTCPWHASSYQMHDLPWEDRLLLHLIKVLTAMSVDNTALWDGTSCTDVSEEHFAFIFTCLYAGFLLTLFFRPWRWWRYVPPKYRLTLNGLHGVISQKMVLFIEAVCSSETSVNNYQSTRRHIPANSTVNTDCSSSCFSQIWFAAPGLDSKLWGSRGNQNVQAPISNNRFRLWHAVA
jgi:hypothetical protein